MINYNDSNAIKLKSTNAYPNGANSATEVSVYKCPCKKGRIVYENVRGFDDRYAYFQCKTCESKYYFKYGCGHFWELEEK
jgi:hypothetical protein